MNRIEQGFLGVAAVCAVVAGGWCFYEYVWNPALDIIWDHSEDDYPGGHIAYYDVSMEPWPNGAHMTLYVTCSMPSVKPTTMWINAPGWVDADGHEGPFEFRLHYGTLKYKVHGAEGIYLDGSYDLSQVTLTIEDKALMPIRKVSDSPPAR